MADKFILQDKSHNYTEPFADLIISEEISDTDEHVWTFTNNSPETVTYGYGTDGELACDSLTADISYKVPFIDTYITIEAGHKLTDYVIIYGDGSYRSTSDHTALVFRENSGFQITVPPLTDIVLSLYLSTNADGESHKVVISKGNSTAEPEEGYTATVSTFVEDDYSTSEHYTFTLKNPNTTDDLDFFVHTESESETEGTFLRLLYLTTTAYSNVLDDNQEYTLNESETTPNPEVIYKWDVSGNLPVGCVEEFEIQPFSTFVVKGNFEGNTSNGRFILQDKTHHYTEPQGALLIDEVVGSASDKEWTLSNDSAEKVYFALGSADEEVYCTELTITETYRIINLDTYPTIPSGDKGEDNGIIIEDIKSYTSDSPTLRRADSEYSAIVFDADNGIKFTVQKGYIARVTMYLSKHNKDDGDITIQYSTGNSENTGTDLTTVSTFIDADDIAPEAFTFQVTSADADVDYFIHTKEGQAHIHHLTVEKFAIIDDNSQRYLIRETTPSKESKLIDTQTTFEIGCLDTEKTTFEVPAFSDTTIKGVFTTNTSNGRFVLQDKTHNYSEPQANYLIDEVVGTGTYEWTLTNPTAETIKYAFGSAGEKVTCDELTYTTYQHTIDVVTREFLEEKEITGTGVTIYGTGVYSSYTVDGYYSSFHTLVFGTDSGFSFDVPPNEYVRLGLYLSTDAKDESHKVVISDPDGNEKTATISTFVDSKDTAPTFVSLTLSNTDSSAKTYKIHTDEGQLRLVYLSLEHYELINDYHQRYEVYGTPTQYSTATTNNSNIALFDVDTSTTIEVPQFSTLTITGNFSSNTSDGSFVVLDKTHNYEQSEVFTINEKVGTGTYEWTIENKTAEPVTYAFGSLNEVVRCTSLKRVVMKDRVVIAPGNFITDHTFGKDPEGRGDAEVYGDWVYAANTTHSAIVLSIDSGVHFSLATDSVLRLNLWMGSDGTNQTIIIRKDDPTTGDIIYSYNVSKVVDADNVDSHNGQTVIINNGEKVANYYLCTQAGEALLLVFSCEYFSADKNYVVAKTTRTKNYFIQVDTSKDENPGSGSGSEDPDENPGGDGGGGFVDKKDDKD